MKIIRLLFKTMEKQQETEEVQAKIQEILEKCKQGAIYLIVEKKMKTQKYLLVCIGIFAKNKKEKQKSPLSK